MNLIKKILFAVGLVFPALLLPAQIAPFGISNRDRTPFESAPPDLSDSIVQLTAEAQGLQLVPPDQIPFSGTFWTIMPGAGNMALPYPCPPLGVNLPTYSLPGGSYLVDYTASTNAVTQADLTAQATLVVNLIDQAQAITASQPARPMARMMVGGLPMPGGGGTNTYGGDFVTNTLPIYDYGTNLWLAQVNISSNYLTAIASNTFPDVPYEIQSWSDLDQPTNWVSQGFFLGSETTNWTPLTPLPASRTNNFYVGLRSWASSDGSGLPDWWELEYFGALGINPNALDSAGDGFTIYQKFVMGVAPNTWVTPAAPQNFTTSYNLNISTETVTWSPSPGPVTSYTLSVNNEDTGLSTNLTLSATNTSFSMYLDPGSSAPDFPPYGPRIIVIYGLAANYGTNGSSAGDSQYAEGDPAPSGELVYGADGRLGYVFQNLPSDLASVRIYRQQSYAAYLGLDYNGVDGPYAEDDLLDVFYNSSIADGYFEISADGLTNGVCEFPDSQAPPYYGYDFWVQTVRSNGVDSAWAAATPLDYHVYSASLPFLDARRQLKDNLIFSLRAADDSGPFAFQVNEGGEHNYLPPVFTWPDNYVYADYYNYVSGLAFAIDDLMPLHQNYFYRNFLFDQYNLTTNGFINTGCAETDPVSITNYPTYYFDAPAFVTATNPAVPSSQLTTALSEWTLPRNAYPVDLPGGTWEGDTNYYGLPYVSETIAGQSNGVSYLSTVSPGQTALGGFNGVIYNDVAQPGFQSTGYYFAKPGIDPMPEQSGFSPSGPQPLMLAGVGNSLTVAGYNNLVVTNGYSGVYGYLGQYFAGAYQITNGIVTANSAGIVSPYGVFSPTVPGPAALVTMPDIDTGEQGTCTVNVVSLQLSKTPAADMTDTSFNSPDATSPASPMVFWCNNNFDRLAYDSDDNAWYLDDVPSDSHPAWGADGPNPDFNYPNYELLGERSIPNTRDLEDFARLWVCGVTSNLLAALPGDSTVTLSWGSVSAGNPAIDLFIAADADGGIGYLTNSTTATQQVNTAQCPFIGRIAPGGSIRLNASTFAGNWAGNHFIWCGVSNGTGGLTLTIADGSGNVLAQTTAYIQIQDIKQMYERWTVGDNISVAPTNNAILATEGLLPPTPAFQYPQPTVTNTPYILFVHGWNMTSEEKDRFAETAYKRLYWQGYQGRFGSFRWPTGNGFTGWTSILTDPDNFDNSEFNAWQSGAGLLNKLKDLNSIYPGNVYLMAHSMGNVVAGEALRLAGTQVVNTYVAMQAAVASQAYDPTTPTRSLGILDSGTPNRYAQYYASGAPCYFNGSSGAGTYVNFFNTNDFALGKWQVDQNLKPDSGYSWTYEGPTNTEFYTYTSPFLQTRNLYFPTNTYEIFSHGDEARCYALGAQPNVGGAFESGLVLQQVELDIPPFNFQQQHVYHSYEFRVDYPPNVGFWNNLLISMKLK